MNSLIFNTTASQLKSNANLYGYNTNTATLELLKLDASGNLLIASNSMTVAGTVTVGNSITIANTSLTVLVNGNTFTSDAATLQGVTGTGNIFDGKDVSSLRTATMFIDNIGTNPITVSLQLSPDGTLYINDPNYTNQIISGETNSVAVVGTFSKYVRLTYDTGALAATFNAYYNAQA